MKISTLIIDGPYLSHKSYDAPYAIHRSDGLKVTHIHAFIQGFQALRKQFNPDKTIVAWESHGTPSWRREILPEYKPKVTVPTDFIEQQEDLKKVLYLLGVPQYYSPQNEADDVIATLVEIHKNLKLVPIVIHTTDKDMMQLVDSDVKVWSTKQLVDEEAVIHKFKVPPNRLCDLLAVTGDSSDNIPGVAGYGPVKASKIIKQFDRIERIPITVFSLDYLKMLERNKKLIKLNKKCDLVSYKLSEQTTLEKIFDKYSLPSLKKKIPELKLQVTVKSLSQFY